MAKQVATYPSDEQRETWEQEAEEMDMFLSEWAQSMIEAGRKDFSIDVEPDESAVELREQRNDLRDKLARTRAWIEKLENELHRGERAKILSFIEKNPGVEDDEIINEVVQTAGPRVLKTLDALEATEIRKEDGRYYPRDP